MARPSCSSADITEAPRAEALPAHLRTAMELNLEFGGGMELLFDNKQQQKVTIPRFYDDDVLKRTDVVEKPVDFPETGKEADVRFLIWWMRHYLLADKERPSLFVQGESIRPGILILINSVDWELEGELDYKLQPGDEIVFISTLHGG